MYFELFKMGLKGLRCAILRKKKLKHVQSVIGPHDACDNNDYIGKIFLNKVPKLVTCPEKII